MFAGSSNVRLNGGVDANILRSRLNNRIDLLDFPKFGGVSGLDSVKNSKSLPFPYFADIRYVYNTPVLYNYPSMHERVLNSERVKIQIFELVENRQGSFSSISSNARKFYSGIRASISRIWCRFLGYLMFKIFRRVMSRLLILPRQLKELKRAHDTGIPIVYLPLHRSHMDYQIITWTVYHFGCRIPYVAAGNNLNLSGFGWFLRATGAFFIKRHFSPGTRDVLYRSVLNTYMTELLKDGQSLEFFLEGTRSRFGKTLLPKNGLISNIIQAVESRELNDVYLVPVSVNYDSRIEGLFYSELMGSRKPTENLISVLWGIFECFRRKFACGTVCIDFGEPILLSEELKAVRSTNIAELGLDYATNQNSYRELLPWDDHSFKHKTVIRAVGYNAVYRAQRQKPIGITSLISILFLCKYRRRAVKLSEIVSDMWTLIKEIDMLEYEVVGWFTDETTPESLILNSLDYFEDGLIVCEDSIQVNDCHKSWITLAYHKNMGLAPFTLISISAILYCNESVTDHKKQFQTLCSFLRFEVLLCSPLDSFEELAQNSINFFNDNLNSFDPQFYARMILPFIITLQFVANYVLLNPTRYNHLTDVAFIRHVVQAMFENEDLIYREAANSDSVYNSLKALRIWGSVNELKIELLSESLTKQIIFQLRCFIEDPSLSDVTEA